MIIVHANLQIKPDQEEAFLREVKAVIEATRKEEGNLSYELKKSVDQEHHYTMIELWKDMEAAQSHNTSEHFASFVNQARSLLAAPMELNLYKAERIQL
ncbi:putative quinol monooxygenase [Cohnella sp. AR92]|uniref:putative quinol monooxygenase n=1 Tax=Cohnella sp. AR92 TaxID=648716 RepID=UPI000F8D1F21|nr:putative quinol monooxygenase [Cohnella sp. AR92]RUS46252.1 antibiotic biosynthesis monooxygenase [Cohnella sp. AR92]